MLDIRFIRANPELVEEAAARKNIKLDLTGLLGVDEQRRKMLVEVENLKAERNRVSEEIGRLKKAGAAAADKAEEMTARMRETAQRIKEIDAQVAEANARLEALLLNVPNIAHESVPVGPDAESNKEVRKWGEPRAFAFEPRAHWDVGAALGILDFERASKMAGARFPLLKGAGAHLERALINFMLDLHTTKHGYTESVPPFMVNRDAMVCTGQLPRFEEDMFKVSNNGFYLIPTAEVPLTNIHREEVVDESALPLYYTAYTPCFRAEAGSAGRDTRGVIRNHQFNKVELVKYCLPENSFDELESLTRNAEAVLQALGLPYRVMLLCTGDMSFGSAKTYDLEVWLPSYNAYKEISSCSNMTDFQARRGGIRFRRAATGKVELAHTLNGSGLAVGRTWAAVLENFQNQDGSVTIPEALRPYMGGMEAIRPG
ncbi:MAG: serine--tRNA ligase [Firmicutes bacterium]|nr:serine--tRNA ligase [Bacillota bacterium]